MDLVSLFAVSYFKDYPNVAPGDDARNDNSWGLSTQYFELPFPLHLLAMVFGEPSVVMLFVPR